MLALNVVQVPNSSPRWTEFISHWPLWSIYVAHFCMNWSNYIIMQWLPTYMARNLGANTHDIMFTAIPYLLNSLIGVSKSSSVFSVADNLYVYTVCMYVTFIRCTSRNTKHNQNYVQYRGRKKTENYLLFYKPI